MKKLVIYTCVTGAYDAVPQPGAVDSRCDYVCFVPSGDVRPEVGEAWQVREFDCPPLSAVLRSRYPKLHPADLLQDYECSLWMDANVSIADAAFYDLVFSLVESGSVWSGIVHPERDCAYDEALACLRGGKSSLRPMLRAVNFLRRRGLPRHAGLWENNVILRRHAEPSVVQADRLWWDLLVSVAPRDQILLPLCLRDAGLVPAPLFGRDFSARNTPLLSYLYHDRPEDQSFMKKKIRGLRRFLSVRILSARLRKL